jgi:hypothetical protein
LMCLVDGQGILIAILVLDTFTVRKGHA